MAFLCVEVVFVVSDCLFSETTLPYVPSWWVSD
jgi:hypothetical protein